MTPTLPPAQSCPSPCHTLDQYAQNTSLFAGHTNISLVFLKGVHNLSYTLNISGLDLNTNISLLAFQGQGALPGDTVINLLPPTSISLSNITHLRMLDMHVEAFQQVTIDQMLCRESQISQIDCRQVHFVEHYRLKTKNIITCFDRITVVNIQDCRVVDGLIFTSYSITVNVWNCAIDGGAIKSWNVNSLDIQNCRVVDGIILTLSSHTVNI